MKKLAILCTLISLLTTSCSELTRPNNLENPQLQGWIYRNSIDYTLYKNITEGFIRKIKRGELLINHRRFLNDTEKIDFEMFIKRSQWRESFEKIKGNNPSEYADWLWDDCHIETFMLELCQAYYEEFNNIASREFSVLNWEYDKDYLGDAYTGYLIEYEIGTGYYVLLRLIEYDNSNRCQYSILYQGRSFAEMKSLYI